MNNLSDYYRALTSGERRGPLASLQRGGLWLLSIGYGLGMRLRNWSFDRGWKKSRKVAVPVISVGNLTLGGTGKTPCVELVAEFFRRRGVRVAILSRGYGSTAGRNDEAMVLEENLPDVPHLQGPDRVALAQAAIDELESELLILDDGFQHRRLQRDLDLVLIDCTNPWGHGGLFPRGWLREPASSLKRTGLVLLTRCDQVGTTELQRLREAVLRFHPQATMLEAAHGPVALVNARMQTAPLDRLRSAPVIAFCGLGNPEAFRRTLADVGASVTEFRGYPDHHAYTRKAGRQGPECLVVTTQKDLVKLRLDRLGSHELWAVRIRLRIVHGEEAFEAKLAALWPDRSTSIEQLAC